jgi:hypothetical protein
MYKKKYLKYKDKYLELKNKQIGGVNPCKNQCGYNALPGKDYCCMTCKDTGGANHGASLTQGTHPKKVGASTSAGARISSCSRISSISLTNPGQTLPRIMG